MRYLIISDIHANLEALTAVLANAHEQYDAVVNCGDLMGYGPDPNAVVAWVREHEIAVVRGNHDKACGFLTDLEWFNPVARASDLWTHDVLSAENLTFLRDLAKGPLSLDGFQILHGAPQDEDEYVVNEMDVQTASPHMGADLAFFGHTHLQGGFAIHRNGIMRTSADYFAIDESMRYLVNPGSVGQPRDRDWRAAYALYDSVEGVVTFRRCEYDVGSTYRKIVEAGLPEVLGRRLYSGA